MTNTERAPKKLEEAINGLVLLIQSQKIQQGDRLKPERELALELSASRATIREAIRRLEAVSVLQVKAGSGCYLHVPATEIPRLTEGLLGHESHFDPLQALETMEMIYPLLWPLILKRATASDHVTLHEILIQFSRQVIEGDAQKTYELDLRFHRFLSSLSGNKYLAEAINSLMPLLQYFWNQVNPVDTFCTNAHFSGYVGLLNALKKNDLSGLQQSFVQVIMQMKEWLSQSRPKPISQHFGGINER